MTPPETPLPEIIWVAAKPPLPPFSGGTLKARSGLTALVAATAVTLVTFAPVGQSDAVGARLREYWRGAPLTLRVIEYGPTLPAAQALRRRRFQFGSSIESSSLPQVLEELNWSGAGRLLLFDDIVFAPMLPRYGHSAINSPHDCISEMSRSHFRYAFPHRSALKYAVQARIARHYEQTFYQSALLTHLVTHRDRVWLQEINPAARYQTVPYTDTTLSLRGGPAEVDVLIWADLRLAAGRQGARALLQALARSPGMAARRVVLVGKVPLDEATRILGSARPAFVRYSRYLEDDAGQTQQAKIFVIPDFGGAGIKSRCLSVLYSGGCLACLYSQMEGLEPFCDTGAINARTMTELTAQIQDALQTGTFTQTAAAGGTLYDRHFNDAVIQQAWVGMVRRAVAIREGRGGGLK